MDLLALKTEDYAGVGYRAELVRAEVGGAHGVCAHPERPARFEGQVYAAAEFVGESVLIAGGRLRREVRITDQGMRPEFDAFFRGPTKPRTAAAEQEPGADVVLRGVGRGEFAIESEPVLPIINDAVVEAVHGLGDAGQFVETQERVTAVELPGVSFENAGNVLRRRSGTHERQGRRGSQAAGLCTRRGHGEWRERDGWSTCGEVRGGGHGIIGSRQQNGIGGGALCAGAKG